MAYYHARANVCRAGVTHAGLANHPCVITIGGTNRTANVLLEGFAVTSTLDGAPSSCQLTVQGFTPALGGTVTIALGGETVWAGTIIDARVSVQKFASGAVFWDLQAIDNAWQMDRYALVTLQAPAIRGVNGLVAEILRISSDPALPFTTGYVPLELGDVGPFTFHFSTVSNALAQIAAACGAFVRVTPRRTVDMFTSLPASNALTIGNSSEIRDVVYESSLAQLRTRSFFSGGGGSTTALVSAGATTVPVDECSWYSSSSVPVETPGNRWSYTGRTAESGPGSLTGCTDINYDIPQGTKVSVVYRGINSSAETALAAIFGGGMGGRVVRWFQAGDVTSNVSKTLADDDVATYAAALPSLSYTTTARFHEPGKPVAVSTTDPITISGDFRIQSVTMRPFGPIVGNTPRFEYQVQCRLVRRADILDKV